MSLIFAEEDAIDEGDEGVVCFVEFAVSSKDSMKLLYFSEVTLRHISFLIQLLVILTRLLAVETAKERGLARRLVEGIEQRLAEGHSKGKIKVTRSMKQLGLAADVIAQVTGFSAEEMEQL